VLAVLVEASGQAAYLLQVCGHEAAAEKAAFHPAEEHAESGVGHALNADANHTITTGSAHHFRHRKVKICAQSVQPPQLRLELGPSLRHIKRAIAGSMDAQQVPRAVWSDGSESRVMEVVHKGERYRLDVVLDESPLGETAQAPSLPASGETRIVDHRSLLSTQYGRTRIQCPAAS
jgi:hypothetical protein